MRGCSILDRNLAFSWDCLKSVFLKSSTALLNQAIFHCSRRPSHAFCFPLFLLCREAAQLKNAIMFETESHRDLCSIGPGAQPLGPGGVPVASRSRLSRLESSKSSTVYLPTSAELSCPSKVHPTAGAQKISFIFS